MATPSANSIPRRVLGTYTRMVTPRASGLPSNSVILLIPAVFTLMTVVLVALGISGTSEGIYWSLFGSGADPALLAGTPRPIRSDEWLVQSSWIMSQVQQGFPISNQSLPGGMDATVQNDLPSRDWSTAFRPHVIGFLLLSLDSAMAVRWWLPALGVLISVYLFVVSLLPRDPITGAALAVSVLLSPLLQWWFLPTTLWPITFAFLVMTTVVVSVRTRRAWPKWVLAGLSGYVAVTTAMSIYVPFIVPAMLVVAFFVTGAVMFEWKARQRPLGRVLASLAPLVIAAAAALAVLVLWVLTRVDTVEAVTSTVYPGERLEKTGAAVSMSAVAALFSGPFQRSLLSGATEAIGPNQSEAASPLVIAVFLLVALLWAALARGSRSEGVDFMSLSVAAATLVVLAFSFVPNWDAVAHLLFIDRTTTGRIRLAFVILGVVGVVLLVRRLRSIGRSAPWLLTIASVAPVFLATGMVWLFLQQSDSEVAGGVRAWVVCTLLLAVAVAFSARAKPMLASTSLLLASVVVGWGINPLYAGVFDLRETEIGEEVAQLESEQPESEWVGIGGYAPTAVLLHSGVTAFNGVQTYPPEQMWESIDPSGRYENEWNRLANVSWTLGEGEPMVSNPVRDQVVVTFDSCSDFAQDNVEFVLTDIEIDQPCLNEIVTAEEGASTMRIYEVRD
ncbi:MAG: hypothetical protein JWL94_1517 [Microbacteriaceae bacterium]|nr:hypothetical protein [Microbacteriaceae bacterium]HEV7957593.1 hypothetical protein [Marisediminicola sp.]